MAQTGPHASGTLENWCCLAASLPWCPGASVGERDDGAGALERLGARQDDVHVHRGVPLQQLHAAGKVALQRGAAGRTRQRIGQLTCLQASKQSGRFARWSVLRLSAPLRGASVAAWLCPRWREGSGQAAGVRGTAPSRLTSSSSRRTCSSMAQHRRSRQSVRPAGSASRLSHRRSASGKGNSWVRARVIHLARGGWVGRPRA